MCVCFFFFLKTDTGITNEGAEAFLEALKENTTLTELDMRSLKDTHIKETIIVINKLKNFIDNEIDDEIKKMFEEAWNEHSGYIYI